MHLQTSEVQKGFAEIKKTNEPGKSWIPMMLIFTTGKSAEKDGNTAEMARY